MNKIEFYIDTFSYIDSNNDLDLSFIPPLQKRKLSNFNRAVFYTLNKTYSNNVENIVYASRYGEFDKLLKIIEQYKNENEVSPLLFSSSVHNFTTGLFLLFKKTNIPYIAISSMEDTLSMGLLNCITNKYNTNLMCFADYINGIPIALSLKVSKNKSFGQHCVLSFANSIGQDNNLNFLINFLRGKVDKVQFNNYKIERLK